MEVEAAYFMDGGAMTAAEIPAELFTHLFCAFADIDRTTYEVVADRVNNDEKKTSFTHFCSAVRESNPSIKTLLSIGGANEDLLPVFSAMARSLDTRARFISSSIQLARECGFDGLDLDYEVPKYLADMENVGYLLREWRIAVNNEHRDTGRTTLLLTAAVRYTSTNYDNISYPAASIDANLDWINVMSYDYTTSDYKTWGSPTSTAFTSALYGSPQNGSKGVEDWINAGVRAKKIVFGIPFYGYGWKLASPANHGLGDAANGPYRNGDGTIAYKDLTTYIRNNREAEFNLEFVECYNYDEGTWVSYNDTRVVTTKVQYARARGLLGYFAWQLAQDDDNFTLSKATKNA